MIFGTNLKIYNAKNDLVDLDDLDSIFSVSPEGFGELLKIIFLMLVLVLKAVGLI